jgi:thymidine kinase
MDTQLKSSTGTFSPQLSGHLELIVAPMFSSKTFTLVMKSSEKVGIGSKVVYINHTDDVRSGVEGGDGKTFTSHSGALTCLPPGVVGIRTRHLSNIDVTPFDFIAVDEGNFYDDIFEAVSQWVCRLHKNVCVAGLNGDFEMNHFGKLHLLYPFANKIKMLTATCLDCKDELLKSGYTGPMPEFPAPFTMRTATSHEQKLVGGKDKYKSVCRYHHKVPDCQ